MEIFLAETSCKTVRQKVECQDMTHHFSSVSHTGLDRKANSDIYMKTTQTNARSLAAAVTLIGSLVGGANAANIAVGGSLSNTTIASGDWWQQTNLVSTIGSGVTVAVTNPNFETIIQQNSGDTSVLNIETGGLFDTSAATGNGQRLYLGNASTGTGIINLNGGTFDGSGLTNEFVFGRSGATGTFNISDGTATFAAGPTFTNGTVNFTTGSTGSLTVTGQNQAYFESLFAAGNLTHNGSSSGTFSDLFSVSGATLTAVPEPSSVALLGLGCLGLAFRRSRR